MELVPTERLGRVISLDYFGSFALMPVGFVLAAAVQPLGAARDADRDRPDPVRLAARCSRCSAGGCARSRPGRARARPEPAIGVPRFELGTSPTRTERATRLRHTPRPAQVTPLRLGAVSVQFRAFLAASVEATPRRRSQP